MDTINDKTDYREVSSSLHTLQFTKDDQETLWRVVGAILHLGNIEFDEVEEKLVVKKSKSVDIAAELLQVKSNCTLKLTAYLPKHLVFKLVFFPFFNVALSPA